MSENKNKILGIIGESRIDDEGNYELKAQSVEGEDGYYIDLRGNRAMIRKVGDVPDLSQFPKVYEFADLPFEIDLKNFVLMMISRDFVSDREPLFKLSITDEDIDNELAKRDNFIGTRHDIEFLVAYRKFLEKAIDYDCIMFHSSVVEVDGMGFAFSAKSGTGKSTHRSLWEKVYGDKLTVINDDKPILRIKEDGVYAYGTPWSGKENIYTNKSVKLGGICFIHQAKENSIKEITPQEALKKILPQVYLIDDPIARVKLLSVVNKITETVPFYEMGCTISEEAAKMSHDFMMARAK